VVSSSPRRSDLHAMAMVCRLRITSLSKTSQLAAAKFVAPPQTRWSYKAVVTALWTHALPWRFTWLRRSCRQRPAMSSGLAPRRCVPVQLLYFCRGHR
jgi:hypothetical protein